MGDSVHKTQGIRNLEKTEGGEEGTQHGSKTRKTTRR
jgi:hypothetical protein